MKLFVGLGNPDEKYRRNRHNVGFMAVEKIAEDHGFAPWREKFSGLVSEGRFGSEKVLLLKPATYMNRSGDSVQAAAAFYKLGPEDIAVFHDELDLAPGRLRVKTGGGHAGHNGLRSIAAHLGPDFLRIRIGIGHPGNKKQVSNYVLGDFASFEHDWLEPLLDAISRAAPDLARGEAAAFASAVAQHLAPPPKPTRKPEPPAPPQTAPQAVRPEAAAPDARTLLQKLAEKFR